MEKKKTLRRTSKIQILDIQTHKNPQEPKIKKQIIKEKQSLKIELPDH